MSNAILKALRSHVPALAGGMALLGSVASAPAQTSFSTGPEAHYDHAQANYYLVKNTACRTADMQSTILILAQEIDWTDIYLKQVAGLLQAAKSLPASDTPAITRRSLLAAWLPIWNAERATMWRWLGDLQSRPKCLELAPPARPAAPPRPPGRVA